MPYTIEYELVHPLWEYPHPIPNYRLHRAYAVDLESGEELTGYVLLRKHNLCWVGCAFYRDGQLQLGMELAGREDVWFTQEIYGFGKFPKPDYREVCQFYFSFSRKMERKRRRRRRRRRRRTVAPAPSPIQTTEGGATTMRENLLYSIQYSPEPLGRVMVKGTKYILHRAWIRELAYDYTTSGYVMVRHRGPSLAVVQAYEEAYPYPWYAILPYEISEAVPSCQSTYPSSRIDPDELLEEFRRIEERRRSAAC